MFGEQIINTLKYNTFQCITSLKYDLSDRVYSNDVVLFCILHYHCCSSGCALLGRDLGHSWDPLEPLAQFGGHRTWILYVTLMYYIDICSLATLFVTPVELSLRQISNQHDGMTRQRITRWLKLPCLMDVSTIFAGLLRS